MSQDWNKIFAAVLTGCLVALLAGFIAHIALKPEPLKQAAYPAPVTQSTTTASSPAAETGPEDIRPLLASADIAAGQRITRVCAACHTFDKGGPNKVGPNLWGIVGNKKAHAPDFSYSSAVANAKGFWTYEDLNKFLYSPRDFLPGTKMTYAGVKNTQDRANLIGYLRTLSDKPQPLP